MTVSSSKDLETLHTILNTLHEDIRFTMQYINKEQPFLDVLVRNNEGKIETDIFYKDTDSKQYLLFYSCHPRHTKMNIPFNLARRLRTIISEEPNLQVRLQELKSFLVEQKYPEPVIDFGISKAMAIDKVALRTVKSKPEECVIHFVSTFNPKNPEIFPVIINNLSILEKDEKMNDTISKYKFIKSKRQPYNLKRLLTKAKFTSNYEQTVKKCNRPNCGLCILEGNCFKFNCGTKFTQICHAI